MHKAERPHSALKEQLCIISLCLLLFFGCETKEPELNNPTSPSSKTNPSGIDPGLSSVTITTTGPYTANGIDEIIIDVVMKDTDNRSLYQVVPGFQITNTDNKNSILCTSSNLAGESRCRIRSTRAEIKTIRLTFPFSMNLGTATFVHDVPAAIGINRQPSVSGVAGTALATQPIAQVFDAYGNPAFTAVNPLTANFYSDSSCTTASAGVVGVTTNPVVGDGTTSLYNFAGLSTTLAARHYIGFISAGLTSGCTQAIDIGNNFTYSAVFVVQPSAVATAGIAFTQFPVVRIQDQFGNIALEGGIDDANVTLAPYTNATCTTAMTTGLPGLVGVHPLRSDNGLTIQANSAEAGPFQLNHTRSGNLYIRASATGVTSGCSSLVVVSPDVPNDTETIIAATSPVAANDFHTSNITIRIRDQYRNNIPGIVPTFSTTGTGNTQTACSSSSGAGLSACTVRSSVDEVKTIEVLTPVSKTTTTTFLYPPDPAQSSIVGTGPVTADNVDSSTITITLIDDTLTPVVGITPTFTATNTGATNVYGACSASNGAGISTCTLRSRDAETKTLTMQLPMVLVGGTVVFEAGAVSGPDSDITGTGPVVADDASLSTISITLRDSFTNPVAGQTPTFSATDTGGTNFYGACTASDVNGESTCSMRSQKAEVKTLSLATPAVTVGGNVTFNAGAAVVANSSIDGTSPIFANDVAVSQIEIELFDVFMNPAEGVTPTFTATNGPNTYGLCSAANAAGLSQCTMSSAVDGLKTLEIATPVTVAGTVVNFSAAALIELEATSDLENYGAVAVDTTHVFRIENTAAHASGVITVTFSPAVPPRWTLTTDGCDGVDLASAGTCDIAVTFNGATAPSAIYFATVTIASTNAGTVVLNLQAEKP